MSNYLSLYKKKGYFKSQKRIPISLIKKIKDDLLKKKIGKIYYDEKGIIRRSEKIYNKTKNLKKLNIILEKKILNFFGKRLVIFKDKCNFKPPGGLGFKAHYDGIFYFRNKKNERKKGWYEYSDFFINVLVALDDCNKRNGTIEISNWHNKSFDELYKNTKRDGSPELSDKIEKKLTYRSINLRKGEILFFSNKCPHRSNVNKSKKSRMILYYTYSKGRTNLYTKYFKDKSYSKNKFKALK